MIVIHYPTAFRALDLFVRCYNDTPSNGGAPLRTGPVAAAREIIRLYGVSLLKTTSMTDIDPNHLPSLQTNNQQLAKQLCCSTRTIQRYIRKLQDVQLITAKNFRGSNANYELWFNPRVLLVKEKLDAEKCRQDYYRLFSGLVEKEKQTLAVAEQTTKCPHTYSGNTGNILNNLIITVQKPEKRLISPETSANAGIPLVEKPGNRSGNTEEIAKAEVKAFLKKNKKDCAGNFCGQNVEKTEEIASRADTSIHRDGVIDPARDNSLTLYTRLFWMMAKNLLYKDITLTDHVLSLTRVRIRALYEPVKDQHLDYVHQHYIARLSLVAKFIARDPSKRFVMLPHLYFDTSNANGFVGTKKWYREHLARQQSNAKERKCGDAIRKYLRNEKKHTSEQRDRLKVYRECENTVGKLNDPILLQRFYAAVHRPEVFNSLTLTNH